MIGEILKNRREELGHDLKEVAHTLRIQYEYLKALENNTPGKLPPAVYTRGYIREYARFLGIDPSPLLEEYGGQTELEENVQPETPPPAKRFTFSRSFFLLPLIIAFVLAIAFFFPKGRTAFRESPVERAHLPATVERQTPSSDSYKVSPRPVSSESSPKPVNPEPRYALSIVATDTTWLHIDSGDGRAEELLMKPGDSLNWTSQKGFDLKLGNAGGVRLVLNGKDLGVPGEKGRVLRLKFPQDNSPMQSPG